MSEPPTTAPQTVDVRDDTTANRYEARVGDRLVGTARYLRTTGLIAFLHTEVEPEYEMRGVGGVLVRRSLDEAREQGAAVLAACPFYAGWISRHPAYRDLLHSERSRAADRGRP
ncbi:GNAT family N-acetyltransferase [Streptomyces diastaticus]|uniref:GNAT family N-acetyltransferase n=1 Tax=Streptomyces diastaticus TaxID=1956 RepID=UPI0035E0DFD4